MGSAPRRRMIFILLFVILASSLSFSSVKNRMVASTSARRAPGLRPPCSRSAARGACLPCANAWLPPCLPRWLLACLPANVPAACLPAKVAAWLAACLPRCLPAKVPGCLPAWLGSQVYTSQKSKIYYYPDNGRSTAPYK